MSAPRSRQVLVERSCGEAPAAAAPLDGSAAAASGGATSATFSGVVFPAGGVYRLCFAASASAPYEMLDPTIVVAGCARRCTGRGMETIGLFPSAMQSRPVAIVSSVE